MSHILVWSSSASALSSAIATTSGGLAADGQVLLDALTVAGNRYDVRYGSSGGAVDLAKGSWITSTTAAWDVVDKIARHVLGSGSPLAFSAYDRSPLDSRVASARVMGPGATARGELNAATSDFAAVWNPNANFPNTNPFLAVAVSGPTYRKFKTDDSIRTAELAVAALMVAANEWVAGVT